MKPDKTEPLVKLQPCLKDILTWISSNFLLFNSDKTEVIVFCPKHGLADFTLASSTTVKNLGVIFDQDMFF